MITLKTKLILIALYPGAYLQVATFAQLEDKIQHPPFPRLQSGHLLFQRPSPQKQSPTNDTPDVSFSLASPLAGGPFVTSSTGGDTQDREPRSREME